MQLQGSSQGEKDFLQLKTKKDGICAGWL